MGSRRRGRGDGVIARDVVIARMLLEFDLCVNFYFYFLLGLVGFARGVCLFVNR